MAAAKAMTKSQIADALAEKTGVTKKVATQFMEEYATLAYKEAKKGFTLPGLGKLVLVQRKARMGRNPATGATITIKASKSVRFKVGKELKEAVNKGKK